MNLIPMMTPEIRQTLGRILNTYLPDWKSLEQQANKTIGNQKPFAKATWNETDSFRTPVKGIDHDIWQIEDGICLQTHPTLFERIIAMLMTLVNILLAPLRAIQRKIEDMIFALADKFGQLGGILSIPFAFLLMIIDFFRDYLTKVLRSITNPFLLIITIISFPLWLIKTIFSRLIETFMAPLLAKIFSQIQKSQQMLIDFLAKYGWLRGVLLGMMRDNSRPDLPIVIIPKWAVSEVRLVNKWSLSGSKKFLIVVEGEKLKSGFMEYLTLKFKQIVLPYYWERTVHMLMVQKKEAEQIKSAIEDALRHDASEAEKKQDTQEIITQPGIETTSPQHKITLVKGASTTPAMTTPIAQYKITLAKGASVEPDMTTPTSPAREVIESTISLDGQKFNKLKIAIGAITAILIVFVGYFSYQHYFVKQNAIEHIVTDNNTPVKPPGNILTTNNAAIQTPHSSTSENKDVRSPEMPNSWSISSDKLFTGAGVPLDQNITKLISALESHSGEGAPVSKQEFLNMLSRPEARTIYYKEIMKYATPVSLEVQKKEHDDYIKIFMRENYQKAGLEFLKTQRDYLERVEREYGVLKRDIVSLLIWESGLGKFTGDYREFNVFLGQILFLDQAQKIAVRNIVAEGKPNPLDDPTHAVKERKRLERRKAQAIENLAALLRYCKKTGFDPFDIKGSWGGAIGNVQFMPANLKLAVDGDRDGKLDLNQWPDAIMSAGNYLKIRGKYDSTDAGRRRALIRYNPSSEYADGVMLLAEAIWKRHLNGE